VSPSPILAGIAEKQRLATTFWLTWRRRLETALRNILSRMFGELFGAVGVKNGQCDESKLCLEAS
jgi:hypothetical protein